MSQSDIDKNTPQRDEALSGFLNKFFSKPYTNPLPTTASPEEDKDNLLYSLKDARSKLKEQAITNGDTLNNDPKTWPKEYKEALELMYQKILFTKYDGKNNAELLQNKNEHNYYLENVHCYQVRYQPRGKMVLIVESHQKIKNEKMVYF
jgi:hypothetical protein